jgi:CMP-N-acetylneuraminic acid synthetase
MERGILENTKSRLGGKIGIHEMSKEMSFEIDTPEDYRIVESIGKNIEFAAKKS